MYELEWLYSKLKYDSAEVLNPKEMAFHVPTKKITIIWDIAAAFMGQNWAYPPLLV